MFATQKARSNICVIELDPVVLEHGKFTDANPDCKGDKPCVFVGMTARTPEKCFAQHKQGIKSNSYVRRDGLRPRARGDAVWQNWRPG